MNLDKLFNQVDKLIEDGQKGSGHFGHRGRPGKRGGSLPKSGGSGSGGDSTVPFDKLNNASVKEKGWSIYHTFPFSNNKAEGPFGIKAEIGEDTSKWVSISMQGVKGSVTYRNGLPSVSKAMKDLDSKTSGGVSKKLTKGLDDEKKNPLEHYKGQQVSASTVRTPYPPFKAASNWSFPNELGFERVSLTKDQAVYKHPLGKALTVNKVGKSEVDWIFE